MQIAPTATPFNAQITTVEDVAEIDLGGERHGPQTTDSSPESPHNHRRTNGRDR
jgi:hypothetical protein